MCMAAHLEEAAMAPASGVNASDSISCTEESFDMTYSRGSDGASIGANREAASSTLP